MGAGQSVPGEHSVKVRISNSYQAPRISTAYSQTLQGYITEMEWHHIVSNVATVVAAAGSAERVASRTFWFYAFMILFIVSLFATTIMTPIGCALDGWGAVCKAGVGLGALGVVSMIAFFVLFAMGVAAGRRWSAAAIQAVDAQLLPDIRARHPTMIFELRNLQHDGFDLHVERIPEGRDSLGQVIVAGAVVDPPGVLVASAPTPDALGSSTSQSEGKDGLGAPLLRG